MEKFGIIFVLFIPLVVGLNLCTTYDESCKEENCERSIPCYHGECDIDGHCICDSCYHGNNCEVYDDPYPPLFYSSEEEVYIMDPWTSMPVYTANAYDNDAGYSCQKNSRSCDCAEVVYSLIDEKDYFIISNFSGDIFVRDPNNLITTSHHTVVIKAHSVYQKPGKKEHPESSMKIKFRLHKQEDDLPSTNHHLIAENMLSNLSPLSAESSIIPLDREKRAAPTITNNHLTSFVLEDIGGEWTQMEIGRSVHYKLTATILKTERMSMIVEIFTRQISNSSYTPTLALYDVKVGSKSDGISFVTMEPEADMIISDHVNTVYDRAVINFGDIANDDDKGEVTVLFSVTQIRNPETTYRQEHYVTAGVEYDDETYVWVGQKEIVPQELKEDDAPGIIVEITGPDSINIDSAGVFYLDAWISLRSDYVTLEIMLEDNEFLTVGNVAVLKFGDYYSPVPHDTYYYNDTEKGSETSCQSILRTLPLGLMTNIGPLDKEVKDDRNKIKYTFAVYALNKPANTGETASFSVGILIGEKKVWASNINVTLNAREAAPEPQLYGSQTVAITSSKEVYAGTLMSYTFYTEIKETNGYFTYQIKVEVPTEKGRLKMEPCGGRLVKVPLSFDVPFVACDENVEPVYDGDKTFVFTFNRIHITNQRSPPKFNDTFVAAEIAVKVPSYNESLPGKEMKANVEVNTAEGYVSIPTDSIFLVNAREQPVPTASVRNAAGWDTLYADGAISFNVAISVASGVGYESLIFETSGEEDEILQICRIELISVGVNLPCVQMHREDVNQDITYSMLPSEEGRTKNNRAVMLFGDVGAIRRPEEKDKNRLIVNVIASLIPGSEFESDSTYAMTAGLSITSKSIWAAEVNYTMSSVGRTISEEKKPIVLATITTEKVVAGYVAEVLITVNTAPNSIGKYKISLEATDDKSSVCILRVKSAGRNLPCVDLDTPALYSPHADRDKGVETAKIEFEALSNIGKKQSNQTAEENALVILADIQIAKDATDERKIQWKVDYGSGQIEDELVIALVSDSPPEMYAEDPKSANFSTLPPDITEVAAGVPLFLTLDFELKKFFLAPLTIKALNPVASKHPYEICLAGITYLGVNYPCFSSSNLVTTIPSPGSSFRDTADIDFGMVCNTFFDRENVSENAIQLRVAIRPVEDKKTLGKEISITEHIVVGNRTITNLPIIQAKVVKEVPNTNLPERIMVKAINGSDIPIKVRERIWVPFNITIPPDSILKVSVKASAPFKDARAIMTVHGLRLVSGGPNIPCPLASANFEPVLSSEVPTAQNTTIEASLGYIGNLGITHINGAQGAEGDDDITVEVEVELADHPEAEHGKEYYLDFVVNVDYLESVAKQALIVDRTGEEKADLLATLSVDNSHVYQSGSVIYIYAALRHTNASTAEPHDVTVRLFIPPYTVFFTEVYSFPAKPAYKNDSGGLDIVFPLLTFPDEVEVNFTILADPYKQRKHGKGIVLATTPYRILCLQTVHSQPKQNPEKNTLYDCAPMDHLLYEINSAECDTKLGIDDPTIIEDCQLTASAAASKDWAPHCARVGATNGKGWSPPIIIGLVEPYLQIDFLRTVRVGRIVLEKVEKTYSIIQYEFLYSDTGIDWIPAIKVLDVTFEDGLSTKYLSIPVKGRFFQLKILKREEANDLTKYVGVRMELYGCVVDKEIIERCKEDTTWYTDDKKNVGRHIAVHGETGMGYFCEMLDKPSEKICYSSADGQKWYVLPQNIGSILGYDANTKLIYVADKRDWACMATNDSLHWIAVKKTDCDNIQGKGSFTPRRNIPALPKADLGVISEGNWKANAEALSYSGTTRVKWNQCCKT